MSDDQEKKIIIDEDWKSQVEAEKESAKKGDPVSSPERSSSEKPSPAEPAEKSQPAPEPTAPEQASSEQAPPPATLATMVSMLTTQSLMALGQIPNPATGKAEVNLTEAQYLIDMIAMLEEKTDGNRTPEESSVFADLLHQLRMGFVAVQGR